MKSGKYAARGGAKRSLVLVVSVLVLLLAVVGGTLAWLTVQDGAITNTFSPSHVTCEVDENLNDTTKSDVKIKNTSDIPAYIRAYIVVTWKDSEGNVYGQKPVIGTDYTMAMAQNTGWVTGNGGYYYYTSPVAVGDTTDVLISSCAQVGGTNPDGYALSVEIIAEAIQSTPDTAVTSAWGVTVSGGKIVKGSAE